MHMCHLGLNRRKYIIFLMFHEMNLVFFYDTKGYTEIYK